MLRDLFMAPAPIDGRLVQRREPLGPWPKMPQRTPAQREAARRNALTSAAKRRARRTA
jgi:hypothetical protein